MKREKHFVKKCFIFAMTSLLLTNRAKRHIFSSVSAINIFPLKKSVIGNTAQFTASKTITISNAPKEQPFPNVY